VHFQDLVEKQFAPHFEDRFEEVLPITKMDHSRGFSQAKPDNRRSDYGSRKRKGDEIDSTFIGMGVSLFLPHEMPSSLALLRTR